MFASIVVGTDGSDTASTAVRYAIDLARQLGRPLADRQRVRAGLDQRLRDERVEVPRTEWMVNPREDVLAVLKRPPTRGPRGWQSAGRDVRTPGRRGGRDPRRRRGAAFRPDRRRQPRNDGRQTVPARVGPEQGLAPRALLGADRPDDLAPQELGGSVVSRRRGGRGGRSVGAVAAPASTSPYP